MVINIGFPKQYLNQVIDIFLSGFEEKFAYIIKDNKNSYEIYSLLLTNENFIYIEDKGELLGILTYSIKEKSEQRIHLRQIIKLMGIRKGIKVACKLSVFIHKVQKEELYIDYIAVNQNSRGKGIGTKLLHKALEIANEYNKQSVSLQVINTNPRAKKLYESMGFVTIKEVSISPINKWLKWSFDRVYHLQLDIPMFLEDNKL